MKVSLNPDKEYVNKIRNALKNNDNHCPCKIIKDSSTKCMCEEFRNMIENKEYGASCHCGLYYITEN